jgi:AraC-like DNA-binding protein
MKAKLETIQNDSESSFRILLTPNLNDIFYWHFHPEYEIVYVEAKNGIRHIGDHISKYEGSDLALIGPNIPHLNFDYGVKKSVNTVVVQMKENFLGDYFFSLPEMNSIKNLFEKSKKGIVFYGETKKIAGEKLKLLKTLPHFEQLLLLLQIFNLMANSQEIKILNAKPIANACILKEQLRMQLINHYIEANYQNNIDVNIIAKKCNLTTPAFCRYFKKTTHLTFTDFLNQFKINQSKNLLLQNRNVSEACYESGYTNVSYFNKIFKKITGENPSTFRKKHGNGT